MSLFLLAARHFWIALLLGNLLTGYILYRGVQSNERAKHQRALRQEAVTTTLLLCLPWIVAGLGILIGNVPSFFHYFAHGSRNVFVMLFYLSLLLTWLVGWPWLFSPTRNTTGNAWLVRWLVLISGILFFMLFWFIGFPASTFDFLLPS